MADSKNNSVFELISINGRDYEFSLRDDIGCGSFGTVYKGRNLVSVLTYNTAHVYELFDTLFFPLRTQGHRQR